MLCAMVTELNPPIRGAGRRIAIVAARFTADVVEMMVDHTVATLESHGVASDDITLTWVPGSYELPLVCDGYARRADCDGVIALGCVIRGETTHYDYVCEAATEGILRTNLQHHCPVIFGVLTTDNRAQALARADGSKGDKGTDCATAALQMIDILEALHE